MNMRSWIRSGGLALGLMVAGLVQNAGCSSSPQERLDRIAASHRDAGAQPATPEHNAPDADAGLPPEDPVRQPSAEQRPEPPAARQPIDVGVIELFPHIRLDAERQIVEIDGFVPIDCHNPETPVVYLEVVMCARDSKEHEALVATDARPSLIHAALLMLGIEPGEPGRWTFEGGEMRSHAPRGPGLEVTIAYERDGAWVEAPAESWVTSPDGAANPLRPREGGASWIFSGSRLVVRQGAEMYDADGTGVIVGLTTFGSEVVAWHEVFSHDSTVQTPEWIADSRKVPAVMTPVVVRIRPAQAD